MSGSNIDAVVNRSKFGCRFLESEEALQRFTVGLSRQNLILYLGYVVLVRSSYSCRKNFFDATALVKVPLQVCSECWLHGLHICISPSCGCYCLVYDDLMY